METLLEEARRLAGAGVTELTVIAQDTSGYGVDLYGRPRLLELLGGLSRIDALHWVRLLYTYPDTVTPALIDAIRENEKLVNYLDMPLQHVNDAILKAMHRRGSQAHIRRVLEHVERAAPDFILRTTVMVGFPGETDAQFDELLTFLRGHPFDRVGAFAFSPEEGTPAAAMPMQIPEADKQARLDALMAQQRGISRRRGQHSRALRTHAARTGRSYAEAPDVDGRILLPGRRRRARRIPARAPHARARLRHDGRAAMNLPNRPDAAAHVPCARVRGLLLPRARAAVVERAGRGGVRARGGRTDLIDGWYARKHGMVTDFGKLLDPMADKLLVCAAFIMLTGRGDVPALVTFVFVGRELVISAFRLIAAEKGTVIAAGRIGKGKTLLQCVAVVLILLGNPLFCAIGVPMDRIALYAALVLTLWSLIDYVYKNRKVVHRRMIAEIVSVGTELLMGQVVNTDAQFIARHLAPLGYQAFYQVTVGDNPGASHRRGARGARARGRGDLHRRPWADGRRSDQGDRRGGDGHPARPGAGGGGAAERLLRLDRPRDDAQQPQAGALPARRDHPAQPQRHRPRLHHGGGRQGGHPAARGRPRELYPMFTDHVLPYLSRRSGVRLHSRELRAFGMGEAELTYRIRDIIANQTNPTVAPYVKTGEVTLRVTAQCRDEAEGERLVAPMIEAIQARVGLRALQHRRRGARRAVRAPAARARRDALRSRELHRRPARLRHRGQRGQFGLLFRGRDHLFQRGQDAPPRRDARKRSTRTARSATPARREMAAGMRARRRHGPTPLRRPASPARTAARRKSRWALSMWRLPPPPA